MTNSNISLNFLEIKPKDFDIQFYWKKLDEIPDAERAGIYIKHISINNDDKYEKVAICFEPENGFSEKRCKSDLYIDITKHFLLYQVRKKCQNVNVYKTSKDKYSRIYFILNSYSEGLETVWLEPYYLYETKSFGFLIDYRFFVNDLYKKSIGTTVDRKILQLSGTLDNTGKSNKEFYIFKYEKIKQFINKVHGELNGFGVNLDFEIANQLSKLDSFFLAPKIYQFQNDKESKSSYSGLESYYPLQIPLKETKFIFIFKENDRNIAIELLKGLKGESYPQQFSGIKKLFRIPFDNINITGMKVPEIDGKVLDDLVDEIKNSNVNLLPIIITNSKLKEADERLYYSIKYKFTSNNIACQIVTKDLIGNPNSLKYSLSNIGLQIFAKAGGKPWKIKPAINDCLIIGIGNKNKESFILQEDGTEKRVIEKYFTYSVLTDSSGIFKEIQILSEEENEENYYTKLVLKLKKIIELAVEDGNKNIVIHTSHKISKDKVWDKIFETVPDDVMISILIINDHHKYFGYDFSKNSLVPYESSVIAISEFEYLVWFEGLQFNNSAFTKPIGNPIYIKFWYSNNNQKMRNIFFRNQLLQDCINLSGANWRGFKAKQLPVSIFYCQKIAEFLTKFEYYNYNTIHIDNLKPWFL